MALKGLHGKGVLGEPRLGNINYEHDYYSGSQIQIMIGDVLIDSAIGLSYQIQQSKMPIYGYANQYYAFVADGQVMVSGNLVIAFKESGYLLHPMRRFNELNASSTWASPRYKIEGEGKDRKFVQSPSVDISSKDPFLSVARDAQRKQTMRANVEQMFNWESRSGGAANGLNANFDGTYNQFVKQLNKLEDNDFEDWAEVFEDSLWYGGEIQNRFMRDMVDSKNIIEKQLITPEDLLSHRRVDQYPAVDIWIVYGNTSDHTANHTVQKILDVSFTGCSKSFSASGEPVYESYTFIARNLV